MKKEYPCEICGNDTGRELFTYCSVKCARTALEKQKARNPLP